MSNPFKVGDLVRRRVQRCDGSWIYGRAAFEVRQVDGKSLWLMGPAHGSIGSWDSSFFELATQPASIGRKDDSGKLDMTLLDDMPRAVAAIVEVMQWAITDKKPKPYDRGSWLGVHADRYRAAFMRHNRDAAQQASVSNTPTRFERDKETNLLHLSHIACSAMMALENALRELEQDQNANG